MKTYRINLQHKNLTSCKGDCFDDLCFDCRSEIVSSEYDDETDIEMSRELRIPFSPKSTRDYFAISSEESSDNESEMDQSSINDESSNSNTMSQEEIEEEIELKTSRLSIQIQSIHEQFQEFCDTLTHQDSILAQLYRQHSHCSELLATFEDFLVSFEEQTDSYVYCGNWFAQMLLLDDRFSRFDRDGATMIRQLNDKMELLFDQFVEHKRTLIQDQSIRNLNNISNEFRSVNRRIAISELELDDIVDYVEVQTQEQRQLITTFVEIMSAISRAVESTIVCNDIPEFDCFHGQNFLQKFNSSLSAIQII